MNDVRDNPWIECGARVILRQAIERAGVGLPRGLTTGELVDMAKEFKADVGTSADYWLMKAEGSPYVSDRQRDVMVLQAQRALEVFRGTLEEYNWDERSV